ncbi:MAG TPA: outer membrane beta-barrel protein [Burkholderiales bacterium]|jgi:OOP family OmpA-OmpF porin|nr:outer membrane beta-barrel protein [Burkholderiales bacterium]
MKHPALRCTVAALLLSGVCSTYAADYWYAGLGVGYSRIQFYPADFSAGIAGIDETKKEFDAGFKGFLGYQINRNWATEVSYVSLGKFQYRYTNASTNVTQLDDYKVTGWGFSALPTIPFTDNFSLYGRLGAFFSQSRITFYNAGTVVGNNGVGVIGRGTGLLSGLGLQYFFGGENGFRIEYENFGRVGSACTPSVVSCSGRANAKMISVDAIFKF